MACKWCGSEKGRGLCPWSVECPACGAPPGRRCRRPSGHDCEMHSERYRASERLDATEHCPGFEALETQYGVGCAHCSGLPEDHVLAVGEALPLLRAGLVRRPA